MSLADDTNAPVQFKGQTYKALTMANIASLIESLPARLVPRQLIPFVTVAEAMKFARSPYGLPILMGLVSESSGHDHANKLSNADQLTLAGALTDRFYGFDLPDMEGEGPEETEPPEDFQPGPASSPTSPA